MELGESVHLPEKKYSPESLCFICSPRFMLIYVNVD